jgi:hypothetical protein
MSTRKHPARRIFLGLFALLVCFMGYRMVLNFIGYCPDKGRVLTEQEKLAPVIEYLALAHPREASPPLVPPKETRFYYDSMSEFLRDNPDCCHVVKAFYTVDTGWFRLRLVSRFSQVLPALPQRERRSAQGTGARRIPDDVVRKDCRPDRPGLGSKKLSD